MEEFGDKRKVCGRVCLSYEGVGRSGMNLILEKRCNSELIIINF